MKVIDGAMHEGGGSVLRIAVPLATSSSEPLEIINIRKNRKNQGLGYQHLISLRLIAGITGCRIEGLEYRSQSVKIFPPSSDYYFNEQVKIKSNTAASLTLILQCLQNYVLVSGKSLKGEFLGGGTHVDFSPTMDYALNVTNEVYKKLGVNLKVKIKKYGFYPKGGASGEFSIEFDKTSSKKLVLNGKNQRDKVKLYIAISESLKGKNIAERIINGFTDNFQSLPTDSEIVYKSGYSGGGVTAIVNGEIPLGFSRLLKRKIRAELIGKQLAEKVNRNMENIIDQNLADQAILPLAFAKKNSKITIPLTPHVETNIWVTEEILGNIFHKDFNERFVTLTKN